MKEIDQEIIQLLRTNNKMKAIQKCMTLNKITLQQAKAYVEAIEKEIIPPVNINEYINSKEELLAIITSSIPQCKVIDDNVYIPMGYGIKFEINNFTYLFSSHRGVFNCIKYLSNNLSEELMVNKAYITDRHYIMEILSQIE